MFFQFFLLAENIELKNRYTHIEYCYGKLTETFVLREIFIVRRSCPKKMGQPNYMLFYSNFAVALKFF